MCPAERLRWFCRHADIRPQTACQACQIALTPGTRKIYILCYLYCVHTGCGHRAFCGPHFPRKPRYLLRALRIVGYIVRAYGDDRGGTRPDREPRSAWSSQSACTGKHLHSGVATRDIGKEATSGSRQLILRQTGVALVSNYCLMSIRMSDGVSDGEY